MDEEREPPAADQPLDRTAPADAVRFAVPPTVFLIHFGALYGLQGLACAFQWGDGSSGFVGAMLIALTAVAVAAVWLARPRAAPPPGQDVLDPYDPAERRHFMASATRGLCWMAIAAMVLVTLPVLLSPQCTPTQ